MRTTFASLGLIAVATLGLTACADGGGQKFNAQIGAQKPEKKADSEQASETESDNEITDDENALADQPAQVSGAFLSMAFDDSQEETAKVLQDDAEKSVRIAACLRDRATLNCIDTAGLTFEWELVSSDRAYAPVTWEWAPQNYDFSFLLNVPIKSLASTALLKVTETSTGKTALMARSLPSIGEFGAKFGRTGGKDTLTTVAAGGDTFDANEEANELGLALAGAPVLGKSAAGQASGAAAAATSEQTAAAAQNDSGDEDEFWGKALSLIGTVAGAAASQPASNVTTEPVVQCKSCPPDTKFIVVVPDEQTNASAKPQAGKYSKSTGGYNGDGGWFNGGWQKPKQGSDYGWPTQKSSGYGANGGNVQY